MDKQYSLVSLKGELYMIDGEAELEKNDWYLDSDGFFTQVVDEDFIKSLKEKQGLNKILASQNKSLGLPLLPAIEEDVEILAEAFVSDVRWMETINAGNENQMKYIIDKHKISFIAGYKANKALYTEEDMKNFAIAYAQYTYNTESDFQIKKGRDSHIETINDFIRCKNPFQSLKKIPIACEIEVEEFDDIDSDGHTILGTVWEPKADENNFLIVKNWIYDRKN